MITKEVEEDDIQWIRIEDLETTSLIELNRLPSKAVQALINIIEKGKYSPIEVTSGNVVKHHINNTHLCEAYFRVRMSFVPVVLREELNDSSGDEQAVGGRKVPPEVDWEDRDEEPF